MKLTKGQKLDSGFSIIDVVDLAEMKATGIWARHENGAEVFHVLNDDSENLFSFSFATAPNDNTGVAHILEHTVLSGSENYPLKDAFLVLAQGSLQTFLNAMTYPDKTVYPASSVNESDYFNLMSVYGDAVFRPLLSQWSFMQEGHRHEITNNDGKGEKLSVTGVVYNEMKGAYSSLEAYAGLWSAKAVLPDTVYGFESGGNPEQIPDLTLEGLKDFHNRRYSPANCRIFLAGNISTEKQLAFLNDKFFSHINSGKSNAKIAPLEAQKRWNSPKEYKVPCPAGGETKPTVFVSWLCCDATDINETMALGILCDILLGHDGSPLMKTLVESGLGEDISPVTGLETEIVQTVFTVGLRGVEAGNEKKVEQLIIGELQKLANEGIPQKEIESAILHMEFSQREIKRSGGPFSLVWMGRCLRAWMHGSKPWESLLLEPPMKEIKNRLAADSRYFEALIRKYLLDNSHRATVTVEPQDDFLTKQETAFAEKLAKKMQGLSTQEKQSIAAKSAELEKIQTEGDTPEALASIPHLSRNDLSTEPETTPRHHENLGGIPALCHELHTNGISYIELAFPIDKVPREDYIWLPFFGRAATSVGLPGMDYAEVSSLLAQNVGGFNFSLQTGSPSPSQNDLIQTPFGEFDLAGRDWLIYRMKCLDEKVEPSLDIILRLINDAEFGAHRRIKDLVMEMKNQFASSLAPYGSRYASSRADRLASPSTQTGEMWNGISQLLFANNLAKMDIAKVSAKLQTLREAANSGGIIVNLAGSSSALRANATAIASRFGHFGAPKPRKVQETTQNQRENTSPAACEVFASPSLQIGFAAMTLKASGFDTKASTAEWVAAHHLSTGALWEAIRMKGGAYGASASSDSLERCFSLSTYRDPNPMRSMESFSAVLKSQAADPLSENDLVKTIIGCYAKDTRPRTPAEKSVGDFLRFLSRIDDGYRKRKLERLVNIHADDVSHALVNIAPQEPFGKTVITGMKDAEQVAKTMGVQVQELPF